jgi:hypothetical protein
MSMPDCGERERQLAGRNKSACRWRKAVSYKRLLELETQLRTKVEELFALSEQSEQPEVPGGLVVSAEHSGGIPIQQ